LRYFYKRRVCAKISDEMMMKLAILTLITVLGGLTVAHADDQKTNSQVIASSSTLQRRAYPGGRDESDLTVQPHKRITKKQQDSEAGFEAEPDTTTSGEDQGFGE
jgi:hypothetical protein